MLFPPLMAVFLCCRCWCRRSPHPCAHAHVHMHCRCPFVAVSAQETAAQTTIMAVEFDGGVVFGADSRTTTGSYVANRVTDKLTEVIPDRVYCCRSGSAADTQAIADVVQFQTALLEQSLGQAPSVSAAANLFKRMCFSSRDRISAGIICAGWDERNGGQVFSIPLGGMLRRQPFAIGGSGSTYIYGHCDASYRRGMAKDECLEFVAGGALSPSARAPPALACRCVCV